MVVIGTGMVFITGTILLGVGAIGVVGDYFSRVSKKKLRNLKTHNKEDRNG